MTEPQIRRRKNRPVTVGAVKVGGGSPVSVQSMTNTDTRDVAATVSQIRRLEKAGCEIIRVAVPDRAAADAIAAIKRKISIPLVADIHFSAELAVRSIAAGADGIRINPGNIGSRARVRTVVDAAKKAGIPIRIGVNSGSIVPNDPQWVRPKNFSLAKHMVRAAARYAKMVEGMGFRDIVISLKAPDAMTVIEANTLMADKYPYPLHIGVTHAGTKDAGYLKSAIALGGLLARGIGDTIRISFTGDPVDEVTAALEILKAVGLRRSGPTFVSCPTCGRCQVDLVAIEKNVRRKLRDLKAPLTIAVMGCMVNGPGESREADLGIACGKGKGILFRKGVKIATLPERELVARLVLEVRQMAERRS